MPIILLFILLFVGAEFLTLSVLSSLLDLFLSSEQVSWVLLAEFIGSTVFGLHLLKKHRTEGLHTMQRSPDAASLLKQLSMMVAGLLFIIPGILTDILGLLVWRGLGKKILSQRMDQFQSPNGMFQFLYKRGPSGTQYTSYTETSFRSYPDSRQHSHRTEGTSSISHDPDVIDVVAKDRQN